MRILQLNQAMTLYNAKSRIWLWEMGDNVPKLKGCFIASRTSLSFKRPSYNVQPIL